MTDTIQSFEQLDIWQDSQALAVKIYKLTENFPSSEKFGLTNQLRRAASSISANIAEGFGRFSQKDKLHFYTIAYGSLLEVKNFIYLAQKLAFVSAEKSDDILQSIESCQKNLNALMRSVRSRI